MVKRSVGAAGGPAASREKGKGKKPRVPAAARSEPSLLLEFPALDLAALDATVARALGLAAAALASARQRTSSSANGALATRAKALADCARESTFPFLEAPEGGSEDDDSEDDDSDDDYD